MRWRQQQLLLFWDDFDQSAQNLVEFSILACTMNSCPINNLMHHKNTTLQVQFNQIFSDFYPQNS
jgi:hypothetical protein